MKWSRRIKMMAHGDSSEECSMYPVDRNWYAAMGEYTSTVCGENLPDLSFSTDETIEKIIRFSDELFSDEQLRKILSTDDRVVKFDTDPILVMREYALLAEHAIKLRG